jgi:hypothetical protein
MFNQQLPLKESMPRLTKRLVETIEVATAPVYAWDDQLAGFGVKVLPSGRRKYVCKYSLGGGRAGRHRWYLIGTHGQLTCDQAREMAMQILSAVARGQDPQSNRLAAREAPTLSRFIIKGRLAGKPLVNLAKPWKGLCRAAELDGVRIHDLRHTAASVGVGHGLSLPIIGRLLGHSQPQTTNRYAHVDGDPALLAINTIGETIGSALGIPSDTNVVRSPGGER